MPSQLLPGLLVVGVGLGLSLPVAVATAAHHLPAHQQATGSGVVQMAQQLGSVVGVSLLVVCLGLKGHPDPHHNFVVGMWVAFGISLAAALAALGLSGRRRASR